MASSPFVVHTVATENVRPSNGRPGSPCKRSPAAAAAPTRRVITTLETPKKPAVPSFASAAEMQARADAAIQELQSLRERHLETEAALRKSADVLAACERECAAERTQHAATKAALQKVQADTMAQDFAQLELMSLVKTLEAERDTLAARESLLAAEKTSLTGAITSVSWGLDELRSAQTRWLAERDSLQADNAALQVRCRELEGQLAAAATQPPLQLPASSAGPVLVHPQPRRFQQPASAAFKIRRFQQSSSSAFKARRFQQSAGSACKARGVTWAAGVCSPAARPAGVALTQRLDSDSDDESDDSDDDEDDKERFDARQYPATIERIVRSLGSRGTDPDTYFVIFADKPHVAQQCVATELAARPDGKAAIRAFISRPPERRSNADQHVCYVGLGGRAYTCK